MNFQQSKRLYLFFYILVIYLDFLQLIQLFIVGNNTILSSLNILNWVNLICLLFVV